MHPPHRPLALSAPALLLTLAFANACGSDSGARKVNAQEAGADDDAMVPGAGGRGAGGRGAGGRGGATGTGGVASGGTGTGGNAAGGAATGGTANLPDAGAGGAVNDASADSTPTMDASPDSGPVLGDYCVFADAGIESEVRAALSNLSIDGGVPSGPIPVVIASRLRNLDLFCDCGDTRDLGGVECLTGLVSLVLGDTFDTLAPLRLVPNLTTLRLDYRSTLPNGIGTLSQLRSLDLHSSYVSDLTPLATLTGLTELNVAGNTVTDVGPLAGLTNLTNLNLYNNRITDITPLAGLTMLESLDLGNNAITNIAAVEGLTALSYLNVSSSAAITDFSPLVRNAGIGTGDQIYASPLVADCSSFQADVATLAGRGVTLGGFPVCP